LIVSLVARSLLPRRPPLAAAWDRDEFVSLPLGVKLSKMTRIGGRPVQFQLSYEHNFYDAGVGPEDTIGITAKLLVPKGG
jgi:hypothetical protein